MANIKPYRSRKRTARKIVKTGLKSAGVGFKLFLVAIPGILTGGYFGAIYFIRKGVKEGLLEEYAFAPTIMGRVFYAALYGKMPFNDVTPAQMETIAIQLSKQIVRKPFPIPNKQSIGEFVVKRLSGSEFALLVKAFLELWGKKR